MTLFLVGLGCTGLGGSISEFIPTVKFNRLELTDINFEALSVDFVFDVHNPNPVDIPLERFAYGLDLDSVEILSGDNPEGLELRQEATSAMVLPVTLNFQGVYELVTAERGQDAMPFAFRGAFGWDTDIGPVDVSFDESGEFPALRIPEVKVGELALTELTATQAGFELAVDIDNDHGSTLEFANLDFQVAFAGVQVGAGLESSLGSIEGASTDRLVMPFSVDYLAAAAAIAAISSGQQLTVDLAATSDVTTPFGVVPLIIDENGEVNVVDDQ